MATPAERLLELQQRSQFYNPLRGPVMAAGPGMGQEDPSESTLPGQPEPPAPSPAEMQARIAGVKARPEQEPSTRRSADLARRGGEALVAQKKNEAANAAFRQPEEAAGIDRFSRMLNLAQRGGVSGTPDFSMTDILPGEEQVTSQDTFRALDQQEQAALRGKYDTGGHSGTMTFEDWLSENYAELPPEERAAQMRTQGAATPRIQAGRDPRLEPGQNSAVAKSRQEAGKPLPEGREASQYSPEQRRTMQRNVHSPEVPMQRFGGTFTPNVDGSVSSRAPNPAAMQQATAIAADQGEGSQSHVMALAQAYGIDAAQYGDDMDMLRADVMREKERHDRLAQKYDIVSNNMGGFRYTPNSAMKESVDRRKNMIRLDEFGQRFAGMLSPEQEKDLENELAASGASMNDIMRLRRNRGTAQAVRNNWANRNMTIAMNNPRVAQGLYMRSLQEAARSGDPMQVAAVHSSFGNDRAARDYISLAGQQQGAAAAMVAAEAGARGEEKPEAPKSYAEQFHSEMNSALAIADPVQRRTAIIGVLTKMGTVPPEQVEKRADEIIASAGGGPVSPQQTRTWWQWLSGGGQPPEQQQATTPTPTVPPQAAPQQPAPAAPPASGRGGALDSLMRNGIPLFTLPQQTSPYGNRPRSVV
jgi:hypothetical protein